MTPIRISSKNLGQLALVDSCERCFYLRLHCQQRLPFQKFPGIFSSIDSFTKKVTNAHFDRYDRAPAWFNELGELKELVAVPHSKFRVMDETTEVLLTGVPDDLVRKRDGSLIILDYKTSKFSKTQDALLPLYRIQLNSYGYIVERIGMGTVSGLALIYFEPQTAVGADDVDSVIRDDGFAIRFVAKVLPVELALESIPPLLAKVRAIHDLPFAPTGRAGCKDCELLNSLMEIAQ